MDADRLLHELTDFLRIPSVSTLPAHNADCRAAAEWVAGELRRLGCREVQFLASGTHPVVWGVGSAVPGAPDDKGQVFCLLKAIETFDGRPPVNFRFLIEGEEEHGSRVLFDLLRR